MMPGPLYTAAHAALAELFFLIFPFVFGIETSEPAALMRKSQAVIAASIASLAQSDRVLNLSNVDWTLTSPQYSNISVPGKVPSQVHLDLYAANLIDNPLYGLNEFSQRWIANSNWTYTSAPLKSLKRDADATWLVFNGLDTFASIDLCGQHVAVTNNQFRQYYFDVTKALASCKTPVLSVSFGSAPVIANSTAALPGQNSWPFGVQQIFEFPNREFIRKEQNDFGWDWGPAFAPAGIWQPAYIVQLDCKDIFVRNTLIDVYREGQRNLLPPDQTKDWVLNASIDYLGTLPPGAVLEYTIADMSSYTIQSGELTGSSSSKGRLTGSMLISKDIVDLWWPVGMGPQTLYNITLDIVGDDSRIIESVTKRIGFRTIFNNQTPISPTQLAQGAAPGANWHFEINGHEFYAKGSNLIPPDPFWPTVTEARIRTLFESVVDGNQNLLRVWSSGAYSPDFMFDLADEMGLLLWSEFEFACALYPADDGFLENVVQEVEYQVRRVNHHPSLAYWAGGNEFENLELALARYLAPQQFPRYLQEYEKLTLDTIGVTVFENTRSISYSPSSTTNGWLSLDFSKVQPITQRYNNLTKGSIYGNTDHYNYDASEAFNLSTYPIGRFANEFGFHSMPSLQTWQQAVDPKDLYFNSSVVALRDHHPPAGGLSENNHANASQGQGQMTTAAQIWYPVPNKTDPIANFSAWCLTTQIFQADFYKAQIEFYRRGSALPERQLGSLYWQLEDQWQAPTWAGIEYDGRWKVLHYVAKDIYKPVVIAALSNDTTNELEVWVISDLWSPIAASVKLAWYDWAGKKLSIDSPTAANVTVGAINGTKMWNTDLDDLLTGHDANNALLRLEVTANGALPNSKKTQTFTHQDWFHPAPLSKAAIVDPGLHLSYSKTTSKFIVKATKGVAAWVWLDYPAGAVLNFDENAFWLLPGEKKEVGYTVKRDTTSGKWIKGVTVRSLWDNTTP